MSSYPWKQNNISKYLQGIEEIEDKVPWTLAEIMEAKIDGFYPALINESFDTSTFILWNKEHRFKVTDSFPWRTIKSDYLGRSKLGPYSVIEIMPSEYEELESEEFCIAVPVDDQSESYVLPSRYCIPGRKFGKKELLSLGGGIIEQGLTRRQAFSHPIWLEVFHGKKDVLERMVEWVWEKEKWDEILPMGVYIQDPEKFAALPWKVLALNKKNAISACVGFNYGKVFLTTDLAQRKS